MRSFIIFAFGLAMVLALVESKPMEEGDNLQTAEDSVLETERK